MSAQPVEIVYIRTNIVSLYKRMLLKQELAGLTESIQSSIKRAQKKNETCCNDPEITLFWNCKNKNHETELKDETQNSNYVETCTCNLSHDLNYSLIWYHKGVHNFLS